MYCPPDRGSVITAAEDHVSFSLVLPAYQAARALPVTLAELAGAFAAAGSQDHEIIVVDDGSSDDTAGAARRAGAHNVIRHERNRGKGAAVRTGVLAAQGSTIAFTDVDLSYLPADVLKAVGLVQSGAPMVVGDRRDPSSAGDTSALRSLTGRVFSWVVAHWVLGGEARDTQCGLKAFSRPTARVLFESGQVDGFAFDVELFAVAQRRHVPIVEMPVTVRASGGSTVRLGVDAVRMLRDLVRIRRAGR